MSISALVYWTPRNPLSHHPQLIAFDSQTLDSDTNDAQKAQLGNYRRFRNEVLHLASLLHAVALQTLRTDFNLHNLLRHAETAGIPPYDALNLRNIAWMRQRTKRRRARKNAPPHVDAPSGYDIHAGRDVESPYPKLAGHSWIGLLLKYLTFVVSKTFLLNASLRNRAKIAMAMPLPVIGGLTMEEFESLGGPAYDAMQSMADLAQGFRSGEGKSVPGCSERVGDLGRGPLVGGVLVVHLDVFRWAVCFTGPLMDGVVVV